MALLSCLFVNEGQKETAYTEMNQYKPRIIQGVSNQLLFNFSHLVDHR